MEDKRDAEYIEKFCAEIAELWKKCPEKRFSMFIGDMFSEVQSRVFRNVYYVEDDLFMEYVKEIF